MQKHLCLILGLLSGTTLQGQPLLTPDTLKAELEPVEVRAIRSSSKAPFAQSRLNAKDIERQNLGQDLPFLLQQTPSTVVTSDAGNGVGYTGLRIRGTDATRINFTLNGIPVNDAESQVSIFVNFADISSSLNSIQIQRGVGGSTNGAGAFGATISMSNLAVRDSAGGSLQLSAGSFGTQRATLTAGTGWLNNVFALEMRLSQIKSNGFIDRSKSNLQALQVNGTWKLSANTNISALVMTGKEKTDQAWNGTPQEKLFGTEQQLRDHYNNNVGVLYFTPQDSSNLFQSDPRRYNYFTYANQTDNYQQDYYQLHGNHRFSSSFSTNLSLFLTRGRGFYEEYRNQESFEDYNLPNFQLPNSDTQFSTDLIRQLWLDNYFYGGLFSIFYQQPNTKIIFGAGWQQYQGDHYGFVKWANMGVPANHQWYSLFAKKSEAHAFLKAEKTLGSFTLYADAQLRHVDYDMNGFRKNPELKPQVTYNFFNPKAGLRINLANNTQYNMDVYASVARATKEPNRDDFEASPSTLPLPEKLTDYEAGWQILHKNWEAAANVYFMDYTDQLILTGKINDVGAYTRSNVKNSYRTGVEISGAYQYQNWLKASGTLTFSKNKINSFTEFIDDFDTGEQVEIVHHETNIAFSPSTIAALLIEAFPLKNKESLSFYIQNKYVGKQFLDNTQNAARALNSYFLSDMGARYTLPRIAGQQISLQLQVNNVCNKMYESNGYTFSYRYGGALQTSNYYYPQAGRNFLASLQWRF